jgi:hypothetical protein
MPRSNRVSQFKNALNRLANATRNALQPLSTLEALPPPLPTSLQNALARSARPKRKREPKPSPEEQQEGRGHRNSDNEYTIHDDGGFATNNLNQFFHKRLRNEQDLAPGPDGRLMGQPVPSEDTALDSTGGVPLDADLNNILNQNDVELLKNQKHTFLLPTLDEKPKTCEDNCKEINKIKREQCNILRKRVKKWLKENNCPTDVKPSTKKGHSNNEGVSAFYDAREGWVYTKLDENGGALYSRNRNGPWLNKDDWLTTY